MSDTENTSQDNAPSPDDNIGTADKGSFTRRITMLAQAEAKGGAARPGLFAAVVEAAMNKLVTDQDTPVIWERYTSTVNKLKGKAANIAMPSEKQQISKLNAGVRLGQLVHVNGVAVVNATIEAWDEMRAANDGKPPGGVSCFDALVKIARVQVNDQPDAELDLEQIKAALAPRSKEDPTEPDRLEKILDLIEKTVEDKQNLGMTDESRELLLDVGSQIMTRIKDLGGSTKMRKAAEKAEAKAAAAQANLVVFQRDVAAKRAAMTNVSALQAAE